MDDCLFIDTPSWAANFHSILPSRKEPRLSIEHPPVFLGQVVFYMSGFKMDEQRGTLMYSMQTCLQKLRTLMLNFRSHFVQYG